MPPVVAFSIGSFGDILATLQLLYKFREALSEVTGATAEMRVLIDDIDRLTRALIQVKAALERRGTGIQPDIINGIRLAVATCEDILKSALRRIEDFKSRITGATGVSGWRAYCAVLGWGILGEKHVDALRARLSEQMEVIELYLSLSQSNGQAEIQGAIESQGVTLQRMCDAFQDIQLRFDVGLPSFRFFNIWTRRYEMPLARTSIQRMRDIFFQHTGRRDGLERIGRGERTELEDFLDFKMQLPPAEQSYGTIYQAEYEGYNPPIFDCFLFREKAFGQWQVLLSPPPGNSALTDYAPILKVLAERSHDKSTSRARATSSSFAAPPQTRFCTIHMLCDKIPKTVSSPDPARMMVNVRQLVPIPQLGIRLPHHWVGALSDEIAHLFLMLAYPTPEYLRLRPTLLPALKPLCSRGLEPSGETVMRMLAEAPRLPGDRCPFTILVVSLAVTACSTTLT
ncbi:hypothetical protein AURDEDRAFT_172886 [Auricularia subglabra TFB-10046 SS5]|nr:hypothetical protein AURDEDRAFT_172886 [Auricularia subglabra TFB-10046 SS5]